MDFVQLCSGGKDSTLSLIKAEEYGHRCICLGHIAPEADTGDANSFMYQSVGSNLIPTVGRCLNLPTYVLQSAQKTKTTTLTYESTGDKEDEIEHLYVLLKRIKRDFPTLKAVSSGAIFSNYQRNRVESVCGRLGLTSLGFLWRLRQDDVMDMIASNNINAVVIKVSSAGLEPHRHLLKTTNQLMPVFRRLNDKFKFHVAGEGGEYETVVTDCERYGHGRIDIKDHEIVEEGEEGYVVVKEFDFVSKVDGGAEGEAPPVVYIAENEDYEEVGDGVDFVVDAMGGDTSAIKSTMSKSGLFVTSSITSATNSTDIVAQAKSIFSQLDTLLRGRNLKASDVFNVHLYLKDICDFSKINVIYKAYFGTYLPPSRTCIGTGKFMDEGDENCYKVVQLDVSAQRINDDRGGKYELYKNVECLHVQSLSTWAPVCVGPYSQCSIVRGGLMYLAGNIGLVPETMKIVEGGWEKELALCFKNVASVLDCLNSDLGNCFGIVVYVTEDAVEGGEDCFAVIKEVARDQVKCNGTIVKGRAEGLSEEGEGEGELWDGYEDEETWREITGGVSSEDVEIDGVDAVPMDIPISIVVVKDLPVGASIEIEVLNGTEKLSRLGFESKELNIGGGGGGGGVLMSNVLSDRPILWETGYYDQEEYESEVLVYKSGSVTEVSDFEGFATTCKVRFSDEVAAIILTETRKSEERSGVGGGKVEYALAQIATMIWKAKKEANLGTDLGCVRLYYKGGGQWKAREIEEAWAKVSDLGLVLLPVSDLEEGVQFCGHTVAYDGGRAESDMWVKEQR
ncbi:hypothetical protein TrST_g10535 [Triparma strigata]|uniref:Diphthine--ammonia ligase n=1 Tax=Triparma strigata TaxID=1606541 RepID=A0A9W6ZNT3_9STRA|nr:hypothetical protein TrST_g10535 [Triparma strigata]